jgi:hypothetical protein
MRTHRRANLVRVVLAPLVGVALSCGLASAQQGGELSATGRAFDGVRLPLGVSEGRIGFDAQRAWVWEEPPGSGSNGTRRLLLEGDVRASLGRYQFRARRASVWLEKLGSETGGPIYQVYALFDGLETLEGDAAVSVQADRLPVQGVVRVSEPVWLRTDLTRAIRPDGAAQAAFLDQAEALFAARLAEASGMDPAALPQIPSQPVARAGGLADTDQLRAMMGGGADGAPEVARAPQAGPPEKRPLTTTPTEEPPAPIFHGDGVFYVSAGDRFSIQRGEEANTLTLTGGVVVQYSDPRDGQSLQIDAQRAVVFLRPGPIDETLSSFGSRDVLGLYLEGGFQASDGQYTVRGPRAYYDVQRDRAILVDAVFWTYEQRVSMPLYLRAEAIRQEASNQFRADKAEVSNTGFFNPHFSLGASSVSVTLKERDESERQLGGRSYVDARNMTLRGGGLPFFWWPLYKGDPEQFPLKGLAFESSNRTGPGVLTTWNAYSLLGILPPEGLSADLQVDVFTKRGVALGGEFEWNRPGHDGSVFAYMLPSDSGTDLLPGGQEIERDDEFRGALLAQDMWRFREFWTLVAEGSFISDEAFVEAFDRDAAQTRREFTNRAYLRRVEGSLAGTIELKGAVNDFIANEDLLQAPGYLVDKLPEIGARMAGADLFGDLAPGLITHNWEATYARVRQRFSEVTAASQGFVTDSRAQRALGIDADMSLGDRFRAVGFDESFVNRFDTRQELSAPLHAGPINITPFVVGRFTAYDSSFDAFSPYEDDQHRLWGAAGVTLSTTISRVNNAVDSRLFDLHRMRHIIEPSVTVWAAGTNLNSSALPVFDDDVEPLLDGTIVRAAVNQTWQTKRGAPGRWRSVDVFKLNTEVVWTSDDDDRAGAIPRYFDARPELSTPGDHARVEATWQATDVVAFAAESIYDLEINQQARTAAGVLMRHTPEFSSSADIRYINSQNVTYGGMGARYTLTDKYDAFGRVTYNFQRDEFQTFVAQLDRRFPNLTLGIIFRYDNVQGETSFGFTLRPLGLGGRGSGLGGNDRALGG